MLSTPPRGIAPLANVLSPLPAPSHVPVVATVDLGSPEAVVGLMRRSRSPPMAMAPMIHPMLAPPVVSIVEREIEAAAAAAQNAAKDAEREIALASSARDNVNMSTTIESLRGTVINLEQRLRDSNQELDVLTRQNYETRSINSDLQNKTSQLNREVLNTKEELERSSHQCSHLESRLITLEREKERLRADLMASSTEGRSRREVEIELSSARIEMDKLKLECDNKSQALIQSKMQCDHLIRDRDAMESSVKAANARLVQIEQAARDADLLRMEVDRLTELLRQAPVTAEEYAAELARHRQAMEEIQRKYDEELRRSDFVHARQCNDLVSNIEEARQQRDAKIREIAELKLEIERLAKEVEYQRNEAAMAAGLRKEKEYLEIDLRNLKLEMEKLKKENQHLRQEMETLQSTEVRRGSDMQQAFEDLRDAYNAIQSKNDQYRAQLRQATQEFKVLEDRLGHAEKETFYTARHADGTKRAAAERERQAANTINNAEHALAGYVQRNRSSIKKSERPTMDHTIRSMRQSVRALSAGRRN